ncbi:AMP-binding protein [Nocardia nova]|uniref:AMP-binding protein n=1 Tax=Nocardia nova TaxID=37330 RepID=UPI000CE9D1A5|nr:AMP-binding protein [Nocardia nova]PPJ25750.1 hypothetical protein C5E41_18920 [Nocardia nova]
MAGPAPTAKSASSTRSPETFAGYRDAALDAEVWFDAKGGGRPWLRTGDIGRLERHTRDQGQVHRDDEGCLTITDRAKDVIIRAGETISFGEVEDALLACPGVGDEAAVAVPDRRRESPDPRRIDEFPPFSGGHSADGRTDRPGHRAGIRGERDRDRFGILGRHGPD